MRVKRKPFNKDMKCVMKLNPSPFEKIKSGEKTVEIRLYDEKRQLLKVGDALQFIQTQSGETLDVEIVGLRSFPSFQELYQRFDKIAIGYNAEDVAKPEDMYAYYSKEDEKRYGVLAIMIKRI